MKRFRFLAGIAAFAAASVAFADAGNTLVVFSTTGDTYADGVTQVQDGEWYALCWSANETFGGISSECEPIVEGDRVLLAAPLAENGRCPTTAFQIDSKKAPTGGYYFVYLFDTRGVDGKPAKSSGGKPALVNAAVATTAKSGVAKAGESAVVTNSGLAENPEGGAAWGESAIDEAVVGQPVVKAFRVVGDKAMITVSNLHPSVRYNVFTGSSPEDISSATLDVPVSAEKNDLDIIVDKDKGRFFKIGRQPIAK